MSDDGPGGAVAPAADVAAVAALEPPPTSVRDVKTRLRWGAGRAAAALRTWREQRSPRSPAVPRLDPAAAASPAAAPAADAVRAALETALTAGGHGPEHAAAVALARHYADRIDADPDALGKLGRALLAVLVELRLTPRTRVALVPTPTPPGDPHAAEDADDERGDELAKFRAARDSRAYRTPAVDPTTP